MTQQNRTTNVSETNNIILEVRLPANITGCGYYWETEGTI